MRIFSVQCAALVANLFREGIVFNDIKRSEYFEMESFRDAYIYIADMMNKKVKNNFHTMYPFWCWYKNDGKNKAPNYYDYYGDDRSEKLNDEYILEFNVKKNDVLLSDFDLFHYVLNKWVIHSIGKSEEEYDKKQAEIDKMNPEDKKGLMIKSWKNIFNVKNSNCVQANIWYFSLDNLVSVKKFSRPK